MEYYDAIAEGYDGLHKEEQLNKLAIIKGNIKISKDSKLLDVGCGTGISSDFKCFVVGVDKSIEMLRQGKGLNVNSCAENLPFKDKVFDCVVSVTSIHNFSSIKKAMGEIKRVGRQCFVFSVLKKSKKFEGIKRLVESSFQIDKVIEEAKDSIFFCSTV